MGWRPVWFCTMTESPAHLRGVSPWECSSQPLQFDMDRLDKARSRRLRRLDYSVCGRYLSGIPGRRSHMGRPNRQAVGDILVSGSGLFLYWRRALWNRSVKAPPGPVLPASSLLMVFTATLARQLACGWYAEAVLWWTPQFTRNRVVVWEENSGLPSDVSVSGIPNVEKVSRRVWTSPEAPSLEGVTTGQFVYLSTRTRYVFPWWRKKSAAMCWNGYNRASLVLFLTPGMCTIDPETIAKGFSLRFLNFGSDLQRTWGGACGRRLWQGR